MPAAPKPAPRVKKPRKRMNPVSETGMVARQAWATRRDAHLLANPVCILKDVAPGKCWGPLDAHHIEPRGSGGSKADTSPLASLCRYHHGFTEEHREWSRTVGLLVMKKGK